MRTLTFALTIAGLSAISGLVGQAEAASLVATPRTHDTAASISHRPASVAYDTVIASGVAPRAACDSLFCPGYALIGVAF